MKCLRWQKLGCSEIKSRGICERSRDGRRDAFSDLDVYGSPCVWCEEARCTGTSDALCEPLEYLVKGAPAHFPSFLAPGSFTVANCKQKVPLPKLNFDCLLWSQDGCSWIKERNLCLRSRDGKPNSEYTGNSGLGTPCVWCGGGVCTEQSDAVCESYEYLFNGEHVFYDVFHVPEFAEFSSCNQRGHAEIARFGPDQKVVFGNEDIQCGGQRWTGDTECPEGMYCLARGLNAFCVKGEPPQGRFITAGQQVWWHDQMGNSKHMVPPGIDCSKCGCRGNMTIVQQFFIDEIPTGDEFNCGMMKTGPDVPVLSSTVGHFVTAGRQVYFHSPRDFQKHRVEPGIDCSRCGCEGKLVLVAQSDLDAMTSGDAYDCGIEGDAQAATVSEVTPGGSVTVRPPAARVTEEGRNGFQWPLVAGLLILAALLLWLCLYLAGSRKRKRRKSKNNEDRDASASFIHEQGSDYSGSSPPQSPVSSPPASPPPSSLSPVATGSAVSVSPVKSPTVISRTVAPPVMTGVVADPRHYVQTSPQRVSYSQLSAPRRSVASAASSAAATSALNASAVSGAGASQDPNVSTSIFDEIDRDHDGQITREEWQKYAFDAFDRDHDGHVSAKEFKLASGSP